MSVQADNKMMEHEQDGTPVTPRAPPSHQNAGIWSRCQQETHQRDGCRIAQLLPQISRHRGRLRRQIKLLERLSRDGHENALGGFDRPQDLTVLFVDVAASRHSVQGWNAGKPNK